MDIPHDIPENLSGEDVNRDDFDLKVNRKLIRRDIYSIKSTGELVEFLQSVGIKITSVELAEELFLISCNERII